jgi:hypothetical protein
MTDIVERLRTTHAEVVRDDGGECEFIAMFREAADEIERQDQEIQLLIGERIGYERRIDKLEEALQRIVQWSEAYPLDIFPEPDFVLAGVLLRAGGMTLDAISASCMRRVVEGVGKITREALK